MKTVSYPAWILSLLLASASALYSAVPAFAPPAGGWTYMFNGDAAAFAGRNVLGSLDGQWVMATQSGEWDGSAIGGTLGAENRPGGVMVISEGDTSYIRIQDTGDPSDYDGSDSYYGDPGSNRKIYLVHDISSRGGVANVLDTGIALTFRARIPTPAKATGPLDPWHRDGQQASGVKPYPPEGDGYVTSNEGKGNFTLMQWADAFSGSLDGAIAFSLTVSNDTTGGALTPVAGFAGLTMNEFAGNAPSANVNFGQGSKTNVVAFDPTDWHEFWIVIRKDPANVGTHQGYFYMDGSSVPKIFKITSGTGDESNFSGTNYLAIGMPATPQNAALDIDFLGYKIGQFFPPGAFDNLPPDITAVTPTNGATFYPAANGITITATTMTTNSLPASGFKLWLNDEDVSSQLQVAGNVQNRTVTYSALEPNRPYNALLIVSDQAGRSETNEFAFDTFVEADLRAIEAEDYNFSSSACNLDGSITPAPVSGGQYLDDPVPGTAGVPWEQVYTDRVGMRGADYQDANPAGGSYTANNYRLCDGTGTAQSTDALRSKHVFWGAPDYEVNGLTAGDWYNYTRNFTNGNFRVSLRYLASANQTVRLDIVTGDRTQPNQARFTAGFFTLAAGSEYRYAHLVDPDGEPVILNLAGVQTLRLTAVDANDNAAWNYIMLAQTTEAATPLGPIVESVSPANGNQNALRTAPILAVIANRQTSVATNTIKLEFNSVDVTASSTLAPTGSGWQLTYQPPQPLELGSANTVKLTYSDNQANAFERSWAFVTTTDNQPPSVVFAGGAAGSTGIDIMFSEPMDRIKAGQLSNYTLSSGTINKATVVQAGRTVVLSVSALTPGATLAMKGLTDTVGLPLPETPVPLKTALFAVNFQPAAAADQPGYLSDNGLVFADRGNGQSYGWAEDNSSETRDRDSTYAPDDRYDTFDHVHRPSEANNWEIAVPNGRYLVHIVSGDDDNYNSVFILNVDGITVVNGTPTDTDRWIDGVGVVTVSDGRLTVTNGPGFTGNKICFIELFEPPPLSEPPTLTASRSGDNLVIAWDKEFGAAFTVQSTASLGPADWQTVSATIVETADGYQATLPIQPGSRYYRLKQ